MADAMLVALKDSFLHALTQGWAYAQAILDSRLFNAALPALAGAYFGAKTAQGTAARNKFRDDITKEIRDTNAAISLSFALCNSAMAVKKQHILSLAEGFESGRSTVQSFLHLRRVGAIPKNTVLQIGLNLQTLQMPNMPTDKLQAHVLDRLSVIGRPLNLAVSINESAIALREFSSNRNEQIKAMKDAKKKDDADGLRMILNYYGIPIDGHVDETYGTTIEAMALQADCIIYLTYLLCQDLRDHGNDLVAKFRARLDKGAPQITEVDFTPAFKQGLIPSAHEFESWNKAFVKRPKAPTRWERVRSGVSGLRRSPAKA